MHGGARMNWTNDSIMFLLWINQRMPREEAGSVLIGMEISNFFFCGVAENGCVNIIKENLIVK
jgi:hypothetical protein